MTERRTAADWAHFMKDPAELQYPDAEPIRVVVDNLNTNRPGSYSEAFPPCEARRLAAHFEFHYTPKHGSWSNMSEIELSALKQMYLKQRIHWQAALEREIDA